VTDHPTSQDELRQLFKKHAHSCGKLGDVCTCLDRQELEMLIEDIATYYTPKTGQQQRIKYRCPSCSRQELVLHDGLAILRQPRV
jgi:UDP-N-acetylmuramate-alanine ligase